MPSLAESLEALSKVAGEDAVRPATDAEAIQGRRPGLVVEPDSPEATAGVLAWASTARQAIVIRGGGTKLGWGRAPSTIDILLSTRRLSRVVAHAHGDLTATTESGVTLENLNRELSRERQWLPLESAFDGATIGGVLATNETGPLRHRFGAPRDLLIGVRLATTNGRLVKAGGTVVKNVAGYDLGKLITGSFGGLAVIVSATFKLMPVPPAFGTLCMAFDDRDDAAHAAQALAASQLEPVALDLRFSRDAGNSAAGTSVELLARFASTTDVVEAEMAAAERLLVGSGARVLARESGVDDVATWNAHVRRIWNGAGVVLKMTWLPAQIGSVLGLVADISRRGTATELVARVGGGGGLLRIEGDARTQIALVHELRARTDVLTHVVVLRAASDVLSAVDVWGSDGTLKVFQALKGAFDPAGILNAGRGPV